MVVLTHHDRIQLNVGGKLFETTISTLQSGGPDSLLAVLSSGCTKDHGPIFIDRDPSIFSILLSLLRTNCLPSTALQHFSLQDLVDEALYYGIEPLLRSAVSPLPLNGIDVAVIDTLCPAADAIPSAFSPAEDGSVWIAHGGQVSVYDPYLTYTSTFRTHVDDITSICRVWPDIVALGSESTPGIHFYDSSAGRQVSSVHWIDPTDPRVFKACVTAIADSTNTTFASFVCPHKENAVLLIDKSTLQVSSELGRQSGNSAKTMVPGKLTWLPETSLLVGSSVMYGAFGYYGSIMIWDPRTREAVWGANEPGTGRSSRFSDPMADVDADMDGLKLFKICSKSGDLAMADLRYLKEDPWVYMNDNNLRNTNAGGNIVVHCYKRQVFVAREGELEVWSRVHEGEDDSQSQRQSGNDGLCYRSNSVDKPEDAERGVINSIRGGGNRLFVSREDVDGIEVWESSKFSGAVSVL